MEGDLVKLGLAIRSRRSELKLTIRDVSGRTNLSAGLISKIENARTVPSLPVLISIAGALELKVAELVKGIDDGVQAIHQLVRAADCVPVKREAGRGVDYRRILSRRANAQFFNSFVARLAPGATRAKARTDGDEFLFVVSGKLWLELADELLELGEGDSIFFDGSVPHRPLNKGDKEAMYIVTYLLKSSEGETKGAR